MSVDWVRLAADGNETLVEPSPGIELRLTGEMPEYEGYLDPLAIGPSPRFHLALDLIPQTDEAIARCERLAARILEWLGARGSALTPLPEFTLEAALGGEGLPYNRVTAPRLILVPSGPPVFEEDQPLPGVRVLTAKAPSVSGTVYVMTRSE
jgi:hypothetical protein